ncbi:hypothetical protein N473_00625 [Pseudoalteromonas luteoviolacea CPMOR-1]|uniref:Uncharacterized protein n=1 Tax=Pseudoalteromonas luteoviolacea CPMOR-1 TaxID=1365248 RepID=A0A162CB65_9GAMM|nr:hypothetical protein [Pseudoalteromonas luteoviolacea]KZN65104.1 hypothetical protein N473_00625 [Pseudoalteromonas luteoviolacea CPMOR-1]
MLTVVYGITSSTDMFMKSEFNQGNNIFACTYGKEEYQGQLAHSLEDLAKLDPTTISRVVICSEFVQDILKSLKSIDIDISKCFFFNHMREQLVPCDSLLTHAICTNSTLYAIYDLAYNLPCFDVITFIILAEQERIKQNKQYIQFIVLPSWNDSDAGVNVFHTNDDTQWRLEKVVKPMFSCLPSCISVEQPLNRNQIEVYKALNVATHPDNYFKNNRQPAGDFKVLKSLVEEKANLSVLAPPKQAQQIIADYIRHYAQGKKLVTLTLREYDANPEYRNSNLPDWLRFAQTLQDKGFFPLIIRDTYAMGQPLPAEFNHLPTYPAAAIDVHLRLALYQSAYINMGIENGPLYAISYLKGARSIIFRRQSNDIPNLSDRTNQNFFFKVGENHFFNDNQFQINAWMDDSLENLLTQFQQLDESIQCSEK